MLTKNNKIIKDVATVKNLI